MNKKKIYIILFIIIFSSLLLKLFLLFSSEYIIEGDEAIVGIQAIHFLHFKTLHPFVYGQDYMGALESLTAAIFFFLFGISFITLKLVPLFYYILFISAYYIFTKKFFNNTTAVFSLILVAFPSLILNQWCLSPTGGHIENLFLSTLILFFGYKIIYADFYEKKNLYFFSFFAGLAFWTNPFSLILILILSLFIILKIKFKFKKIICSLIFFFIGSIPLWIYNIFYNFITFKKLSAFFLGIRKSQTADISLMLILKNFLLKIIFIFSNILNSLKIIIETFGVNPNKFYSYIFIIVIFISVIYFIYTTIKNKKDNFRILPLIIFLILYLILIFSSSRSIRYRYILPLYIPIPIIFITFLNELFKNISFKKILLTIIIFIIILINIKSTISYSIINSVNAKKGLNLQIEIINFLIDNKIFYAYSDHYTAYPLSFLSREKIIISPKAGYYNEDRILSYSKIVDSSDKKAVIFNLDMEQNIQGKTIFENLIKMYRINYSLKKIENYYIYFNFSENIIIDKFELPRRFKKK